MPVYWSFLILAYVLLFIAYNKTQVVGNINQEESYYVPKALTFIPVFYVAFFVCLRDEVLDTYFYIGDFRNMPTNWEAVRIYTVDSGSK